ncbi:MAG: aspartate/glutamate racemase family protein [Dehalococcoidia bacterium]|nr:aspartate/glutamate racemase family protein [Dehalococcoidia bacterium]
MASRTRIGIMMPSTNTTCEADFQLAAPKDVTIHTHRLWMTNDSSGPEAFDHMNKEIEAASRYLATGKMDAVAYACTSGSMVKGPGHDEEMIQLIESLASAPAAATSAAVVDALRYLGARRVSVATPYPKWQNDKIKEYLEALGFEVLNIEGEPWASQQGHQGINDQDPETILEFAAGVCRPEADVLYCSCTAWRAMEAAEELERRTGKPVVTSNQATIWSAFRKAGITRPIPGFGRLLAAPAPVAVT